MLKCKREGDAREKGKEAEIYREKQTNLKDRENDWGEGNVACVRKKFS